MRMAFVRFLGPVFAVAALATGCAADGSGTCTTSEDCPAALACTTAGQCATVPCEEGCIDGETCLTVDEDGNYDPDAPGVCTSEQCGSRGAGDCPDGEVCIDGACYPDDGGPTRCGCSDDCGAGQGCIEGVCGAPLDVCTDDCQCAVGQTCTDGACGDDPCLDTECTGGQVCDPATGACIDDLCEGVTCGAGQTCNPASGACEGGSAGGLCSPCSTDEDCGGASDACIALGGGNFCGTACTGIDDCPGGFTCLRVDTVVGDQCVPSAGECGGCLVDGCAGGQFCNAATQACEAISGPCQPCSVPGQCGPEGVCSPVGGGSYCLNSCADGGGCGTGYSCVGGACTPDSGSCGGAGCELSPADCSGTTPLLNTAFCGCVECLADGDCSAGQTCSTAGTCITAGAPCESISDCPAGQICDTRVGSCVECITPGDCAAGEVCVAGVCEPCDCPEGFSCTLSGDCEEVGDPSDCSGDSECAGIAIDLGGDGTGATCDSAIGCYTIGVCNGSALGGGLPIDLPIGTTTDPFNAPCPAGTTCGATVTLDLTGGNFLTFACKGCDPGDPSTCREGETCTTPLFPIPDDIPYCSAGGGGGFPFPFP